MSDPLYRSAIAGVLLFLAAAPAAAQSCSRVAVLVEVRDSAGHHLDPAALDSIITTAPGSAPERELFDGRSPPPVPGDPRRYLWRSTSGCHLQVHRISFYQGDRRLHLDFDMDVNTSRRRGPHVFLIQAPPLRSGTFRLRWDPAEPGGRVEEPKRLGSERWVPVPSCPERRDLAAEPGVAAHAAHRTHGPEFVSPMAERRVAA
jgi:hypothetical protein